MVDPSGEDAVDADIVGRRVILLGASNLTRGFSTAVGIVQAIGDGPAEVLAALGHGRSYGTATSVLGRWLPGILDCGLWRAVEKSEPCPTVALVTDVGNDLGYGFSVEQIIRWVDECFDRLEKIGASVAVTELPVENFTTISNWRYLIIRSVLFPRCELSLEEIKQRAASLSQSVCRSAKERQFSIIKPQTDWFGFDPIHIRRRHFNAAWTTMMQPFSIDKPIRVKRSLRRWLTLCGLKAEHYRRFGVEHTAEQPSRRLRDATSIALY